MLRGNTGFGVKPRENIALGRTREPRTAVL
jgi:hypothetical protein